MQNKKGFTLLEILVALFIFTIIAIIMTRALHMVLTTQASTDAHAARLAELQFSTLLLSRDLEQTVNRSVKNQDGIEEAPFEGKNNQVTFTHGGLANPQGQIHRSTLQRTAYLLVKDNLIRQTWEVLDQTAESKPSQRQLLSHVKKLQIEYLDEKNHFSNIWPPQGDGKDWPLPRAVRVTLTLSDWGKLTQFYIISGRKNDKPSK